MSRACARVCPVGPYSAPIIRRLHVTRTIERIDYRLRHWRTCHPAAGCGWEGVGVEAMSYTDCVYEIDGSYCESCDRGGKQAIAIRAALDLLVPKLPGTWPPERVRKAVEILREAVDED